jgi:hypothetical protein
MATFYIFRFAEDVRAREGDQDPPGITTEMGERIPYENAKGLSIPLGSG